MEDKKESHEVFHAFELNPQIKFETQAVTEPVILLLRAHPVTQIPWIINALVLVFLLIILNIFFPLFLNASQILFANIFVAFGIVSYIWFNFLSWFFNVGIITAERIVDIDFHGVLYKEVTQTRLSKVEDITSKAGGYLKSLFNYGDVFVQTAGTDINIEFERVPRPSRVVEIINDLTPV